MTLAPNNNNSLHAILRTWREPDQQNHWLDIVASPLTTQRRKKATAAVPRIDQPRLTISSALSKASTGHFEQGHWRSAVTSDVFTLTPAEKRRHRLMWKHNKGCQYQTVRPSTAPAARTTKKQARARVALDMLELSDNPLTVPVSRPPSESLPLHDGTAMITKLKIPRAKTSVPRDRSARANLSERSAFPSTKRSNRPSEAPLATISNRSRPQTAVGTKSRPKSQKSVCRGLGLTYD